MPRILIVDDEKGVQSALARILEYERYQVAAASSGAEGLERLREGGIDLVLMDVKMPGMDGLETLDEMLRAVPDVPIVMISGHGTIQTAVEASKKGAYDFLEKPLDRDRILLTVKNGLAARNLSRENRYYRQKLDRWGEILGESDAMKEIRRTIERVGPSQARVLIMGENGTGKELVARALHKASPRAGAPFIEVNCAAIPEDLIESELFGHERGSFTGATAQRIGKFELADTGTLFLDEIGDMSLSAQAKVLRVLELGEFSRVGGARTINVDVRVIAATNKNLAREVAGGRFREDLFFRLNVVPLTVPALRDRRSDIPLLARHFVQELSRENKSRARQLSDAAIRALAACPWPGNVRELRNVIERLVILVDREVVDEEDLHAFGGTAAAIPGGADDSFASCATYLEFKEKAERHFLLAKLAENNWSVSSTARRIEMQRSNMYKKIEKYGLRRGEAPPPSSNK
jgi:two-component system nitrogen regulation response regulator NtrX